MYSPPLLPMWLSMTQCLSSHASLLILWMSYWYWDYWKIIDYIQELSSISAVGQDGVLSSLLLKCAAVLAPALKLMFSLSLTHGFIPSSLKRAAITPAFKSCTKTSPSNYRPISLTSTIIKVFGRIIRKQVVIFMHRQGHPNNTQQLVAYVYRPVLMILCTC